MEQPLLERLNPLNDFLFLKIMGEKGDEEQLLTLLRRGRKNFFYPMLAV
jgi:hypothetical protein